MYIHEITCIPKIGKTYSKKVSVSSVKIKRSWCDIQNIRKVNKRFNLQWNDIFINYCNPPPPTPTPRIVLKSMIVFIVNCFHFFEGKCMIDLSNQPCYNLFPAFQSLTASGREQLHAFWQNRDTFGLHREMRFEIVEAFLHLLELSKDFVKHFSLVLIQKQ